MLLKCVKCGNETDWEDINWDWDPDEPFYCPDCAEIAMEVS